mgnify:CR=1 FL=1
MLAPTIESQKSDIFLRKPCLLLVGACIAGPQAQCLTELGEIVKQTILNIPQKYPGVYIDCYTIMPNHIHL